MMAGTCARQKVSRTGNREEAGYVTSFSTALGMHPSGTSFHSRCLGEDRCQVRAKVGWSAYRVDRQTNGREQQDDAERALDQIAVRVRQPRGSDQHANSGRDAHE